MVGGALLGAWLVAVGFPLSDLSCGGLLPGGRRGVGWVLGTRMAASDPPDGRRCR